MASPAPAARSARSPEAWPWQGWAPNKDENRETGLAGERTLG